MLTNIYKEQRIRDEGITLRCEQMIGADFVTTTLDGCERDFDWLNYDRCTYSQNRYFHSENKRINRSD